MEIKTWVAEARKHRGLTQEQLGEALGRGKASVSGWEKGLYEPSYGQMREIARVTGFAMPDGTLELFSDELVEKLRELGPEAINNLEEELRVRFKLKRTESETSFQRTTDAKTSAQKSTRGRKTSRAAKPPREKAA